MQSKRLSYVEITEKDTPLIVKWRGDPDVYRFFLNPHKISEQEHLEWFRHRYLNDNNRVDFMVTITESKEAIGVFGVKRADDMSRVVEISYLLKRESRGKGYATEAILQIIQWAVEYWKSNRVIAEIHKDNEASIRLVQNLGFKKRDSHEGFVVYERML